MDKKFGQGLELEARREENFNRRAGQTKEARISIVNRMAGDLKYYYGQKGDYSNSVLRSTSVPIADMMRNRMTEPQFKSEYGFIPQEDLERDRSRDFVTELGWQSKPNGTHTEVYSPNGTPDYDTEVVLKNGKNVKINFKEYFTFTPTGSTKEEILQEADKYYQAAVAAFKKVDHLAQVNGFKVNGKIEGNLNGLLNNMDSLVVYGSDANAAQAIRLIFNRELEAVGLKQSRPGRANWGVDAKTGNESFSHTQLVAKAIAKNIVKDYQTTKNLTHYNPEQLDTYLQKGVEGFSRQRPTELLNNAL